MEVVNGFPCRNCTEIDKAKKNIDPTAGPDAQPGETKADVLARHLGQQKERFGIVYSYALRTRKSAGFMIRKLSETESQ